ncbi:MAG: hypothetical protein AVDCRST_MAG93-4170, partial [uncultured Chloroflexia bacterium]
WSFRSSSRWRHLSSARSSSRRPTTSRFTRRRGKRTRRPSAA